MALILAKVSWILLSLESRVEWVGADRAEAAAANPGDADPGIRLLGLLAAEEALLVIPVK